MATNPWVPVAARMSRSCTFRRACALASNSHRPSAVATYTSISCQLTAEDHSVRTGGVYPANAAALAASPSWPTGGLPDNPFTGAAMTIGATGAFSQGNCGYSLAAGIYTIEGYGETVLIVTLTNG